MKLIGDFPQTFAKLLTMLNRRVSTQIFGTSLRNLMTRFLYSGKFSIIKFQAFREYISKIKESS